MISMCRADQSTRLSPGAPLEIAPPESMRSLLRLAAAAFSSLNHFP
jgi:hypothetical protein